MILKISEKYQIETDSWNYILQEKFVIQKGKNIGKEYTRNLGFYGKIEHLLNALAEKKLKDVDIISITELKVCIADMRDFISEKAITIEEQLNKFNNRY